MSDDNDGLKNWDHTDEMILRRMERDFEKQKAKTAAATETMTRTLAAILKNEQFKQIASRELLDEYRDDDGEKSRRLRKHIEVHGMGAVSAYEAKQNRYWEEDDGGSDE